MIPSPQRYILVCGTEVYYTSDVYYYAKRTHIIGHCKVYEIIGEDGFFPKEATDNFSELFASKKDCIFSINKDKMRKLYITCKN